MKLHIRDPDAAVTVSIFYKVLYDICSASSQYGRTRHLQGTGKPTHLGLQVPLGDNSSVSGISYSLFTSL